MLMMVDSDYALRFRHSMYSFAARGRSVAVRICRAFLIFEFYCVYAVDFGDRRAA